MIPQKLEIIRKLECSKSQNMFRASNNGLSTAYVIKKQKSQLYFLASLESMKGLFKIRH